AHAVRNGNDVACLGDDLLLAAIAADKRGDSLPDTKSRDAVTERLDGAGDLGPRRVWKPRRDLILVAQGKRVEEVEADRSHLDEDLVRSWVRLRRLFDAERLNPPELPDLRHAHRRLLPRRQRWRDAAVSDIEQSVAKRDGDRLRAIDGAVRAHRRLRVLIDRWLAHGEDRPALPGRRPLRPPGEHSAVARGERRLALRLHGEKLADPLEGVKRHEMKPGLCLRRELHSPAGECHGSLI